MAIISLPAYPGVILKNGSFGVDVALIQTELTALGFPASVDGKFGSGTAKAVVAYQATNGLTPDGIVGKSTWDSLIGQYANTFPQNPVPYPGIVMRQGALGSCVKWFQQNQNNLIPIYSAQLKLAEDGAYGSASAQAASIFQRQFGLSIDGQVGKNTWQTLCAVLIAKANGTPKKVTPVYPGNPLKQGSSGDAVRCVQSYLATVKKQQGLNYPSPTIDGIFGSGTKAAVMGFQAAFGLAVDGIVGNNTWQKLALEFNKGL